MENEIELELHADELDRELHAFVCVVIQYCLLREIRRTRRSSSSTVSLDTSLMRRTEGSQRVCGGVSVLPVACCV